jgi:hypothetical protein
MGNCVAEQQNTSDNNEQISANSGWLAGPGRAWLCSPSFSKARNLLKQQPLKHCCLFFWPPLGLLLSLPESLIGKIVPANIHAYAIFVFGALAFVMQAMVALGNGNGIGNFLIVAAFIYPLAFHCGYFHCGYIILSQKVFNRR